MPAVFYLRYNREADKVARLTSITGDLEILSKRGSEEAKAAKIVGWYSYADERLVCLCRLDGVPWLRVDDFAIPVEDDVHAFWDLVGLPRHEGPVRDCDDFEPREVTVNPAVRAVFRVEKAGEVILFFEHRPFQARNIIVGDMTPFVTEEDYDFMLYVQRVLENLRRRAAFYRPQVT